MCQILCKCYSVKLEMPGGLFYYEETFFPMLVTLIVINKDHENVGQGAPDSIPHGVTVRGEAMELCQKKNSYVVEKSVPFKCIS